MAELKKEEASKSSCSNHTEMTMELGWVAGHNGSIDNKKANRLVKMGAKHGSTDTLTLPPLLCKPLLTSISATNS